MDYHDKYFEGSAWLILGIDRYLKFKEEGKGSLGMAAGSLEYAEKKLQGASKSV